MHPIVSTPVEVPQPLNLIPAVDSATGILVWLPEQVYRLHQSRGDRLALLLMLEPIPDKPPERSDVGGAGGGRTAVTQYSEPRTVQQWAGAFGICTKTMSRWFKSGQVDAVPVGRFWKVAARDVPRGN